MNEFASISDETCVRKFVYDVDEFHDAILREVVLSHPGYVDETGNMFGDAELPNAKLLFQSQHTDIGAVILKLYSVSVFRHDYSYDLHVEIKLGERDITMYPLGTSLSSISEFRARRAEYRILGKEYRGPAYRISNPPESGSDRH